MTENTNNFSEYILQVIREKRKQIKMTQAEMAEKLGIEQATYSSIEIGKTELSLSRYMQIAKILDLDLPIVLENHPSVQSQNVEKLLSETFAKFKEELKKEFVSKELLKRLLDSDRESE